MAFDNSKKARALQLACGKPWRDVAREWRASALSQAEVAERWNALIRPFAPSVQFDQQSVGRLYSEAEEMAVGI